MRAVFGSLLLVGLLPFAEARAAPPDRALTALTDSWQGLLGKYVQKTGGVDYIGLDKDFAALDGFVKGHAKLDPKGWDDSTRKAAYINLYNATMMYNLLKYAHAEKLDLGAAAFTGLEINSIKVTGGNIWNGDYKVDLAGHQVNLDDLEHQLIRGNAKGELAPLKVSHFDPRIHAAVNCAAISCPRVRETAYRPETVDAMLEENIREFLSSDDQFHKLSDGQLKANSIVYWYYDDFEEYGKKHFKDGGAGDYLAQFIAPAAKDHDWKVKHLKENFNDRGKISLKLSSAFAFAYDWVVNDRRNKK